MAEATHVVGVLTRNVLDNAACTQQLQHAIDKGYPIMYVYSEHHGWDFGAFYSRAESDVKRSIAGHEAQVYRDPGTYEFDAMVVELLRRITNCKAKPYL